MFAIPILTKNLEICTNTSSKGGKTARSLRLTLFSFVGVNNQKQPAPCIVCGYCYREIGGTRPYINRPAFPEDKNGT